MTKNKNKTNLPEEIETPKLREIISFLKNISILLILFSSIASFLLVVFSSLTTISTLKNKLVNNEPIIYFVSKINSYSLSETTDIINNMQNKGTFIIFEVLIPTILILIAFISLIVLSNRIIYLIKDIKSNKTLITAEKFNDLKNLRGYLFFTGFFFFLAFFLTILLNSPILSLNRRIIFITL